MIFNRCFTGGLICIYPELNWLQIKL